MVLNALRRDAAEGKASRQEMVDELEATVSPAADRAEVLRLADEMTTHAAMATHIGHMGMDNAAKSAEHRAARAALVRLLGCE